MEVEFREKKNTECFNKICIQNSKIIKDTDESTYFFFLTKEESLSLSFQIHVAMGEKFFTEFLDGGHQYMQCREKSLNHQQKGENSKV